MTGPLDLRFEIDAAERPPLDSVPNGCDHGGAASLRSGNRHRCVEKTRQHEAASILRPPRARGAEWRRQMRVPPSQRRGGFIASGGGRWAGGHRPPANGG